MNPFNWNGPEFLVFYLIVTVTLISVQVWMRRTRETEAHTVANTPKLTAPYLVAYLAGGVNGLIRCIMVTLLERKVLVVAGNGKKANEVIADPAQRSLIQSPLERAVANFFFSKQAAHAVFKAVGPSSEATRIASEYQTSLEAAGLLPAADQRSANLSSAFIVSLVLGLVAGIKIWLALERGHRNIAFLIILSVIACIVSLIMSQRRLTQPGKEALADLRTLFSGLKQQTRSGGATASPADVAFVAAVFGLGALGGARQVYAKSLFPAASSSSGCGSSCGSSSGDGGGVGGCGGGGGCGGCGGG